MCYYFVILAIILTITSVESTEEQLQQFTTHMENAIHIFCDKELTEYQLHKLTDNCGSSCPMGGIGQYETIAKNCLKVEELTDKQKADIFCNEEHRDCMNEGWKHLFPNITTEEGEKIIKEFDNRMGCVKHVFKIE